jgi:hypothetical protein
MIAGATTMTVAGDTLYVGTTSGIQAFSAADGTALAGSGPWMVGTLPTYGMAGAP